MNLIHFFKDGFKEILSGNRAYWLWLLGLTVVIMSGLGAYTDQLSVGMGATGMSDQVSWGAYIANFAFLVGVAAAAVMLVIPAYIFSNKDARHVVMIGEGIAVAAVVMAMLFVVVDLGRPDRMWHMIPLLGRFNFPQSLLAWDVVVLTGYMVLNILIPFYMLYTRYKGQEPNEKIFFPAVLLSIAWAISIHTVTAFLFSANVARPFWHTAILGPRFIASAFCSGPALIILTLQVIHKITSFRVSNEAIHLLAMVTTVALQINLFFLGVEIFTDFYFQNEHSVSAQYLFFGLGQNTALVPWIWSAVFLNIGAVSILMIHRLRVQLRFLNLAAVMVIVGVWIEKGMGLIIPGFVPTPIGEVFEYNPSLVEVLVSAGIWAFGALVFTLLAKVAIPVELGAMKLGTENLGTEKLGTMKTPKALEGE